MLLTDIIRCLGFYMGHVVPSRVSDGHICLLLQPLNCVLFSWTAYDAAIAKFLLPVLLLAWGYVLLVPSHRCIV